MTASYIIEVTYGGYAGSRLQPPEDAEVRLFCAECGEETDGYGDAHDGGLVTCVKGHQVEVQMEEGPDPDEQYEAAREARWDD